MAKSLKFTRRQKKNTESYDIFCGDQIVGMVATFSSGKYQGRSYFPTLQWHTEYDTVEEAQAAVEQSFKLFLKRVLK